MPFIEVNQQLHPLQSGDNLLGGGLEADVRIPQLSAGQQVSIRVERVGALVWSVGQGQMSLNGRALSTEPAALRHADQLLLNGVVVIYLDQAKKAVASARRVVVDSTIPIGATIPMPEAAERLAAALPAAAQAVEAALPLSSSGTGFEAPQEPAKPQTVAILRRLENGPSYVLESGLRIGREKQCDVVIPEPGVSRLHAEISLAGSTYLLRDLGRGGTTVNGNQLTAPHKLRVGDQIEIGSYKFAFLRRPATAEGLVRPSEITPIFASVADAPTHISFGKSGGGNALTWLIILAGAAAAVAIYLL